MIDMKFLQVPAMFNTVMLDVVWIIVGLIAFYAGIKNPISVSVPGVPTQNISVSITNGKLAKTAKGWDVTPTKVGQNCNINVSVKMEDGKVQKFPAKPFRVKALPPPVGYIEYTQQGGTKGKYKGSTPIPKSQLIGSAGIRAELDDADLDVRYTVSGFEMTFFDSMGNGKVEISNSNNWTDKQKDFMRKTRKGQRFYISKIRAKGPDGVERILPTIEVIVR